MQLQIYLEPRTVCGCSFDVVNRGERSKGGGTAPRLWRRLSSPTLSSLVKKESGPRRAVAGLSGRYWFVEICKFVFKAWRSRVLLCKFAFAKHQSLSLGYAEPAPLSGEPCALHRVHNGPSVLGTEGRSAGAVRAAGSAFAAAAAFAEQQADAPEAGEADEGVEDAGDNGGLAAENPGDEVEFENADQAPIQGADDGKDQCDGIHSLCNLQFFYDAPSISNSGGIIRRRGANFCTANHASQLKIY